MTAVPGDLPVVRELSRNPEARRWLADLPRLIDEVRDGFGLVLGAPLHGGSCSWVAPATLADGTGVIVKISWPHREMYAEPAALRLWDGHGAVRLLRHDRSRHALVLERCLPGEQLAARVLDPVPRGAARSPAPVPPGAARASSPASPGSPERALRIAAAVLRRLWSAGVPEAWAAHDPETPESLVDVAADWGDMVSERMARLHPAYDPGLVAEGARLLHDLPLSAPREVVLHGDFNPGNILSSAAGGAAAGADGEDWVAIDPKPMIGDPAYDCWPLIEQIGDPATRRDRVALLAAELDLDPARIAAWCVARSVEAALWRTHHGREHEGVADLAAAAALTRLF
ncbi:aminoglycoside phosphotransferase family protein [Symbioplanes lichenis]|uniref:aminoglycoside phosphotransferase family protein n=1 Tax=Symbioplanes lichenis TaxID=1629072 RepID=UPI002739106E|nr:aminoglycoside phosphotransferase family protein [Actinoplanes lichenis]